MVAWEIDIAYQRILQLTHHRVVNRVLHSRCKAYILALERDGQLQFDVDLLATHNEFIVAQHYGLAIALNVWLGVAADNLNLLLVVGVVVHTPKITARGVVVSRCEVAQLDELATLTYNNLDLVVL